MKMRNVHVVLIPLCYGLTFGFIVPSGIQEIISDLQYNLNMDYSSATKTRNMLHTETKNQSLIYNITTPKSIGVERNINDTLDKDIYEHVQAKTTDVKERAFVYINQRVKKPIWHHFYDNVMQRQEIDSNTRKSYMLNSIFEDLPRQFSIGYAGEKYSKNVEISDKPDRRSHTKTRNEIENDSEKKLKSQAVNEIVSDHREYLELLKAPLLRPQVKQSIEATNNPINDISNYVSTELQKVKNEYVFLNPVEIENINLPEIQNIVQLLSTVHPKENVHVEDLPLDGIRLKFNHSMSDVGQFNNLIKYSLNNNEPDKKYSHNLSYNDFKFCRDCINRAKKYKLSNKLHLETICKCGHNLFLKAN